MQTASIHSLFSKDAYNLEELHWLTKYARVYELYASQYGTILAEPTYSYKYRLVGYGTRVAEDNTEAFLDLYVCHEALNPESMWEQMQFMFEIDELI